MSGAFGWRLNATVLAVGMTLLAGALRADIQVNTYTTSRQTTPVVGVDADGDFVVVWTSYAGTDGAGSSIQGQRYAADGSPGGGEFQVNTYTSNDQLFPAVGVSTSGDFVVVWTSNGSSGTDPTGTSIQAQRYAANGTPVGSQAQVNTYTTGSQAAPRVALDANGNFVVVWDSTGSVATDPLGSIQAQRYAADGTALGGQFQVNTYEDSFQSLPAVAVDADGDFVVVWEGPGPAGTELGKGVREQRYAANGAPLGGEFQVNTYTTGDQRSAAVAMDPDGNFVVAWQSQGSGGTDSSGNSVQIQRYAADGSALGTELQVNTYTTGEQAKPVVSIDANGDIIVAWHSAGSAGNDVYEYSVQTQRFAANGSRLFGELQLNNHVDGLQVQPAVSVRPNGEYVVTWVSHGSAGTDTDVESIQMSGPRAPLAPPLDGAVAFWSFADTLDSLGRESNLGGVGSFSFGNPVTLGPLFAFNADGFAGDEGPVGDCVFSWGQIGDVQMDHEIAMVTNGSMTMWARVRYASFDGVDDVFRFGSTPDPAQSSYELELTSQQARFSVLGLGDATETAVVHGTVLAPARWYDLAGVFDATGVPEIRVYVYDPETGDQVGVPAVLLVPFYQLGLAATLHNLLFLEAPSNTNGCNDGGQIEGAAVWARPLSPGEIELLSAGPQIFADGFESGNTLMWSSAVP